MSINFGCTLFTALRNRGRVVTAKINKCRSVMVALAIILRLGCANVAAQDFNATLPKIFSQYIAYLHNLNLANLRWEGGQLVATIQGVDKYIGRRDEKSKRANDYHRYTHFHGVLPGQVLPNWNGGRVPAHTQFILFHDAEESRWSDAQNRSKSLAVQVILKQPNPNTDPPPKGTEYLPASLTEGQCDQLSDIVRGELGDQAFYPLIRQHKGNVSYQIVYGHPRKVKANGQSFVAHSFPSLTVLSLYAAYHLGSAAVNASAALWSSPFARKIDSALSPYESWGHFKSQGGNFRASGVGGFAGEVANQYGYGRAALAIGLGADVIGGYAAGGFKGVASNLGATAVEMGTQYGVAAYLGGNEMQAEGAGRLAGLATASLSGPQGAITYGVSTVGSDIGSIAASYASARKNGMSSGTFVGETMSNYKTYFWQYFGY